MTFYTIDYLTQRHSWLETATTVVIAVLVIIFAIFAVLYFRNNLKSKYRDLSVMMLLLVAFVIGLQYQDMNQVKSQSAQKAQVVKLLKHVAHNRDVKPVQVAVNSVNLNNNLIVKAGKTFYRVNLSADQSNYTLEKTNLLDEHTVVEVK
ncbi:DUF3290 family protein [Weissella cibaria]|uniref:DUF3290 family protein n=1 Tax=Weissella cibaria TaxID=137591 RepID=UPI000EBB54D9|nr:DUF3290 family protein [Weissella cibaria]WCE25874.1 DUF3290 family protein [Weissella cibaria]WCE28062.1 DUF3290 family protein [Weissella cibaria]HCN26032.1 DUF3290 domain-containing protein [Weissella cibaria]HCU10468.1 DUF3290 domain-containing protein [Weissella cibaria]